MVNSSLFWSENCSRLLQVSASRHLKNPEFYHLHFHQVWKKFCLLFCNTFCHPVSNVTKLFFQRPQAHLHATRDDHLDLEVIEFAEKGRGVVATRDYRKVNKIIINELLD